MQRALLANDEPVFNVGASEVIRDVAVDLRLDITLREDNMEVKLALGTYQILFYGFKIGAQEDLDKVYSIARRYPGISIALLHENCGLLPLQKIYRSGIRGVLDKGAGTTEFGQAVLGVAKNGFYMNSDLLVPMLGGTASAGIAPFDILTKRESAIAGLLLEGKSNR